MKQKILVVLSAVLAFASIAGAQQSRAELVRAAVTAADDFAPERALELVKAALNPALGPAAADTSWVRGVHLLTQLLVEGNNLDLARTWARWAMRMSPAMRIDSVNYVAGVANMLREARTATATRSAGDAVTQTSWAWVARGSTEANGRVNITQGALPVPVNARIVGGGLIPAGGLSLPPGSYEVEAAAPGYLPARVSREVLPGVTVTLSFALTSAAVASDVIAENVRARAVANLAPLQVARFASAPSCAVGAWVSRDGMIVTSYQAIRGADNVTVAGAPARLAAWDVAADVAVLHTPATRTDSMPLSPIIADGQSAWGFRLGADCRTPADSRVRVNQWTDRPRGALQLSGAPASASPGTPLIDVEGRLSGVWSGDAGAVPAPIVATVVAAARRAVTQNQVQAVADVSRRENHAYGSTVIAADLPGTALRVSPLETWQWESLRAAGTAPLTFVGPMGRYRVEATAPGGTTRQQEFTIRPGATERLVLTLRAVAAAPGAGTSTALPRKRSKLPWIIGGVGLAGAGAALALMGGGSTPNGPTDTRGSILIRVPNP